VSENARPTSGEVNSLGKRMIGLLYPSLDGSKLGADDALCLHDQRRMKETQLRVKDKSGLQLTATKDGETRPDGIYSTVNAKLAGTHLAMAGCNRISVTKSAAAAGSCHLGPDRRPKTPLSPRYPHGRRRPSIGRRLASFGRGLLLVVRRRLVSRVGCGG
jgi:hypothetical protein